MQRTNVRPRDNWQSKVEAEGLTFHSPSAMAPKPYWDESAAYRFSAAEIDTLEAAANELQTMCLAAAQNVIDKQRYAELAIQPDAIPLIEWAWNQEPPALYGRFDVAWGGAASSGAPPKLLEYNADTPTSLVEAAVVQWSWLEDMAATLPGGKPDQFNSIHERLIAKWKDVQSYLTEPVYFAALEFDEPDPQHAKEAAEDHLTVTYLRDTAQQAGLADPRARHPGYRLEPGSFLLRRSRSRGKPDPLALQAVPVGRHAARGVRAARARDVSFDDVDRADLENAAFEQRVSCRSCGSFTPIIRCCCLRFSKTMATAAT